MKLSYSVVKWCIKTVPVRSRKRSEGLLLSFYSTISYMSQSGHAHTHTHTHTHTQYK